MEKRVQVLEEYELLDTMQEAEFDDIVELASVFFHTPISLISLLDSHRQWFKAKIGLNVPETPIEHAFCYHAIQRPGEVLVVPDSWQDDRFRDNPLATGEPHVRFYAGAPLVTRDGYALGTLCVIDRQPREFSEEQRRVLRLLANKVIERFELRKQNLVSKREVVATNSRLEIALARLLEAEKIAKIGNWDYNTETGEIYWSPEMYRIYGIEYDPHAPLTIDRWQQMVKAEHREDAGHVRVEIANSGDPFKHEFKVNRADGREQWLLSTIESSDNNHLIGTTLDITDRKKAEEVKRQYTEALEQMIYSLSHNIRKPAANVLGIAAALDRDKLQDNEVKECVPYLKAAADELDSYIRQLNDFIHEQKIGISDKAISKNAT